MTNNWQQYPAALGRVDEALQTLGAGQGVVVFHGMAKPVKTPLVGLPQQPTTRRRPTPRPAARRLPGDRDVMHVAFAQPRPGDPAGSG